MGRISIPGRHVRRACRPRRQSHDRILEKEQLLDTPQKYWWPVLPQNRIDTRLTKRCLKTNIMSEKCTQDCPKKSTTCSAEAPVHVQVFSCCCQPSKCAWGSRITGKSLGKINPIGRARGHGQLVKAIAAMLKHICQCEPSTPHPT